jgi:uncharacterized protein YtpQ (UPF0354 family)
MSLNYTARLPRGTFTERGRQALNVVRNINSTMRNTLSILLAVFLISCDVQNNTVTVKEFTKKYFDSLTNRFPAAKFTIVDDSTIESKFQDNKIRISVDNAYREYQAEPDSLRQVLNRYLKVTSELYSPKGKINIERIVPIIKPVSYLDDIKNLANKLGATKDVEAVYEKYNDQLIIAYAEDTKNSISYLTHDDLKSLAIKTDSLKSIATRNLVTLLPNIQRKGADGVFMLTAGGDYEASIILLDNIFTKESLPVNGDFVIAIPNRDMLLITGSNDKAGISKIKEVATKSFETGNHQVSQWLFRWNGKTFEKFE